MFIIIKRELSSRDYSSLHKVTPKVINTDNIIEYYLEYRKESLNSNDFDTYEDKRAEEFKLPFTWTELIVVIQRNQSLDIDGEYTCTHTYHFTVEEGERIKNKLDALLNVVEL